MRLSLAMVLVAFVLLSGCASAQSSSQDGAKKDACEKSGGYWQAAAGVCERPRS
jgi:uncharacterized protein YceK